MESKFTVTCSEDTANVELCGRLDATNSPLLQEELKKLIGQNIKNLVFQAKDLEYISSAGLRALHNIFKKCTPDGEIIQARENDELYKTPYFKLAGASPDVYSVLNLAGFLHNIPFYPTMEDALKSFD